MRTCTGCRIIAPQRELVRLVLRERSVAAGGARGRAPGGLHLVIDPTPRLPGRGAYVHANPACVTVAGLSRSFRRQIRPADVLRLVAEMSPNHDNSGANDLADHPDEPLQNASQNDPGLEDGDTVEMPPRIMAKDDRSEDARL
jgi:predicted RNA-binding protein YlxR (DUF448 family)